MREKKYANILDDFPETVVQDIKEEIQELEENEEKLSMTRELKFKELQDGIDKETFIEEENVSIDVKENDESLLDDEPVIREVDLSLSKKEMKKQLKEEKKAKKKAQYDLYLTSSFKPLRNRFKLRKVFKVLFKIIFTLGLLIAVAYFLILPIYNKYLASKPKAIFEYSIDYIADELTKFVDENFYENNYKSADVNFMIDSSVSDELGLFGKYYGLKMGFEDNDSETIIYTKDPVTKEVFSYSTVFIDDKEYNLFSHTDNILFSTNKELDFELTKEKTLNKEDLLYLIEKERKVIKKLLDDKYISSHKDEIELDNESMAVVRNSFTLNCDSYNQLMKKYNELLSEDDKYIDLLAQMLGVDENDIVSEFLTFEEELNEDYSLVFNIYTVKGNEVVGFDVEENGFRVLYLYFDEENFDLHLNLSDNECSDGKDCAIENSVVIDLIGDKKDDYTEVEVKYNYVEVATLKVKSITSEKIDFDFEFDYDDFELDGSFLFDFNVKDMKYKLLVDVDVEEENYSFEVNLDYDNEFKITDIDQSKVISYTDKRFENEMIEFYSVLEDKNQLEAFDTWFNAIVSVLNGKEIDLDDLEISI